MTIDKHWVSKVRGWSQQRT